MSDSHNETLQSALRWGARLARIAAIGMAAVLVGNLLAKGRTLPPGHQLAACALTAGGLWLLNREVLGALGAP